jgi:hypothetical protein
MSIPIGYTLPSNTPSRGSSGVTRYLPVDLPLLLDELDRTHYYIDIKDLCGRVSYYTLGWIGDLRM